MNARPGLEGVYVVLVTPLDEQRYQDTESLRSLVRYTLLAGADGLAALGEVSESYSLSDKERMENLAVVFDEAKNRVPIVVGASREATHLAIEAAAVYKDLGAAALMIAPPKNVNLGDEAIFNHYAAISDAVDVPLVVQDEPGSNHPRMSVQLLARLANEVKNARYVKLEEPPTPLKIAKLRQVVGERMKIFGASHGRAYLWEEEQGAAGVMTASPTPEYLVESWRAAKKGNRTKARQIFYYTLPLAHYYGEMAIAVKKAVLVHRRVIKTAKLKQPAGELGEAETRNLIDLLNWVEDGVKRDTGVEPLYAF